MRARLFQVDAFTTRRFAGNPAAVMLMEAFTADALLQAAAAENNLSETAFIAPDGDDYRPRNRPSSRWVGSGRSRSSCLDLVVGGGGG